MFSKIIDITNSEVFVTSNSDIIMSIPLDYIGNKTIGEIVFIPSTLNTSSHSYINSTNIII